MNHLRFRILEELSSSPREPGPFLQNSRNFLRAAKSNSEGGVPIWSKPLRNQKAKVERISAIYDIGSYDHIRFMSRQEISGVFWLVSRNDRDRISDKMREFRSTCDSRIRAEPVRCNPDMTEIGIASQGGNLGIRIQPVAEIDMILLCTIACIESTECEMHPKRRLRNFVIMGRSVLCEFGCLGLVCIFHAQRLMNPTFLGDDVIRVIDARVLPLREQLFRPFAEHVAPGFELATAALVRPLGDRIDLLPAALTWFAFASWLIMLCAASWWAVRITGKSHVARLVFVLLGVSSACIEVPWWFSASTYTLSAACIFAVLAVIASQNPHGIARFALICFGIVMAMSFSAIGLLAVILGGIATLSRYGRSKAAGLDLTALSAGFAISWTIALVMGGDVVETESTRVSLFGFVYALAVPGGVAVPLFLGLDAHSVTARFSFATGVALTMILAMLLLRWRISKPLRIDLAAMAIVPYLVIYPTRSVLVESGAWTEPDFLYFWTSRYHLFITSVLAVASALAVVKLREFLLESGYRNAWILSVTIVCFLAFAQIHNANRMRHFENQPDQAPTLAALVRLRNFADSERISIERLERILPPVRRGWNASVLELRPDCFPLVRLIARRSDFETEGLSGSKDDELRRKLIERLGLRDWRILNAHRWTNLDPADDVDLSGFRPIDPIDLKYENSEPVSTLAWTVREAFGHVEFTIPGLDRSSSVIFDNLQADGTLHIQWTTDETWDDFRFAEFDSKPSTYCPVPKRIIFRRSDFEMNTTNETPPAAVRFRIKSTRAGSLRIGRILIGQ